ncbi:DUF3189 family protein [Alkaliphilus crotonatoxidans]
MYVVYYGSNSNILPAIAAALHLNRLTIPFDATTDNFNTHFEVMNCARGRLVFLGKDQENHQIYVLNTVSSAPIIIPALASVFEMLGVDESLLCLANTTEITNFCLTLASWFFRLGLQKLPHRLVLLGLKKEKEKIKTFVHRIKASL